MWTAQDPRTVSYRKAIAEMIVLDSLPFSCVEGIGFKNLLGKIAPRFSPPGRDATKKLALEYCDNTKISVLQNIEDSLAVSFTADIWTNRCMTPFMGVTAHYINNNYTLCKAVVDMSQFNHPHTGERIRQRFDDVVASINNKKPQIYITTDNAANNKKAFPVLGLDNDEEDGVNVELDYDTEDQDLQTFINRFLDKLALPLSNR